MICMACGGEVIWRNLTTNPWRDCLGCGVRNGTVREDFRACPGCGEDMDDDEDEYCLECDMAPAAKLINESR